MGVLLNEDRFSLSSVSLDVGSVAANTTAEQTFTVPGLRVGDFVLVSKPSLSAGLSVANARVSAANTLAITFGNHTASPIDPAAESYLLFVFRAEKQVTPPNMQ
jgi:hypothetical protein